MPRRVELEAGAELFMQSIAASKRNQVLEVWRSIIERARETIDGDRAADKSTHGAAKVAYAHYLLDRLEREVLPSGITDG